jgi:hypothetical protein
MSAVSATSGAATSTTPAVVITSFPNIPLTTTFTAPADCSGLYQPSLGVFMVDPMTSCLPSGFDVSSTAYFSPGVICPSGYVSACHDTRGVSTITTVTCCPFRDEMSLSCVNTVGLADAWSTLFCTWTAGPTTSVSVTLSADAGTTSTSAVTFSGNQGFNAYGVRMVFESSDIASSTPSSAPKTNAANTTPSTPSTAPTTSATGSSPPSKGTSAGTIAAAVIVPLVVLAAAGGIFLWWRRQRNRKTAHSVGQEVSDIPPKWYNTQSELPAEERRNELSNYREPAELPVGRQ